MLCGFYYRAQLLHSCVGVCVALLVLILALVISVQKKKNVNSLVHYLACSQGEILYIAYSIESEALEY